MLKIAYSRLLNAQVVSTVIWISSWKLHFSSVAAALLDTLRFDCIGAGCWSSSSPSRFWLFLSLTNVLFLFVFCFLSLSSLSSHCLKVNSSCWTTSRHLQRPWMPWPKLLCHRPWACFQICRGCTICRGGLCNWDLVGISLGYSWISQLVIV